jgi:hypothetical protein
MDISRSGLYYQPKGISDEALALMQLIDRQYLATPFYGARKVAAWLQSKGPTGQPETFPLTDADNDGQGHLPPSQNQPAGAGS